MRLRLTIFCALILLVCSSPGLGQEKKFVAKVKLTVQHREPSIEKEMYSYLARELRSLGDVVLVESEEDYRIEVILLTTTNGGVKSGYAVSYVVIKRMGCPSIAKSSDGEPIWLHYDEFIDHSVSTSPLEGLRKNATDAIVDFDTNQLAIERKNFAQFNKLYKK